MARKPVPFWIRILLLVSVALLIASILIFPSELEAAFACERGRKAQKEGRHSTAIKEYELAQERFQDSASIMARLAISYFHNERMEECKELLNRIEGRKVSGALGSKVNGIVKRLDSSYYESKNLVDAMSLFGQEELEKTALKLERYLDKNKKDVMGTFHLANINFDLGEYNEAEKLYIRTIELEPEFYSAYLNLAAICRNTGRLELSEEYCNKVISINKEHPQAFVALSKLALSRDNPALFLEYARRAYDYSDSDLQVISNLCIAYHYNNMLSERDNIYKILKYKDYYDIEALAALFEKAPIKK